MRNESRWLPFIAVWLVTVFLLAACTPGTTPTQATTAKPAPQTTSLASSSLAPQMKPTSSPGSAPVSFAGKIITFVPPYAPGSSSDIMARLYALHIGRFLPGRPSVIVRNIPGGNSIVGSNYVYSAKPDGLTGLVCASSPMLADLMNMKDARFELVKMSAVIGASVGTVFYAKQGVIDRPEDLPKARGIVFGYSSGTTGWMFVVAKELLNIPVEKVVLAYAGSGEARRAFLSGELNMSADSIPGYMETTAPLVAKGEVKLVFQVGFLDNQGNLVKDPSLPPQVPTIQDLYETIYAKRPSGMAWDAYRALVAVGTMYDKLYSLPQGHRIVLPGLIGTRRTQC